MPNGGINGRKRNFGKLNTPMGDFDWLGAQSNYRVKYFEGSNYVKMTETQNQTVPKVCKKIAKSMQNLFKKYAKFMQNVCKYYAKKLQKLCKKYSKNYAKRIQSCIAHLYIHQETRFAGFQVRAPSSYVHRVTSEVAHVSFLPEVIAQI